MILSGVQSNIHGPRLSSPAGSQKCASMRAMLAADFEQIQILQLILSKILPSSPGQLEARTCLPLPSSLVMGTCLQTHANHCVRVS